jgi:hypothetical protein
MHHVVEVPKTNWWASTCVPASFDPAGIPGRSLLRRRPRRHSAGVVSRHLRNLIAGFDAGRKATP